MDRYIGIDAHSTSCTVAVLGPSGRRLNSHVVETNGKALIEILRGIPGRKHVCFEEGTQSDWLHEILQPHVDEITVTTPRKRPGQKDDLRDAFALAEDLRVGAIQLHIFKAPKQFSALRSAVRSYAMIVEDVTRTKNRLKAVYRSRGIVTDKTIYDASARRPWIETLPASHRVLASALGAQLDALAPLKEQAAGVLLEEAKPFAVVRRLQTAPGMGTIRTAELVAIVVTPHRFRTSRQFWSYCGLGIVMRSSSDWVQNGGRWARAEVHRTRGLNRNCNRRLKAIFKGAATTVITRMPDHPLHVSYQRMLSGGTKPNLAKLTIARRIAAAVLAMWKANKEYDATRAEATQKTA